MDILEKKKFIQILGFFPKNNSKGIYRKKYVSSSYILEVDFDKEFINYGKKIKSESKTTQNFSQEENWVVLECVDRLLNKGYNPEDLTLEKVYRAGHGHSGRLDILVKNGKKSYLMIECKTFGKEFTKEFNNIKKNGGQLFTYFQLDRDVEYLILYASQLNNKKINYVNEIVKIEESYKETSNVQDLFSRWSKLTIQNGLFETWVDAYDFKSKALTLSQLKHITQSDSSFIFNRFLEILRHNVVSDKPNAFNKIFTLFLCKIVDENRNHNDQLDFQWIEGKDDHISFQKRLTDLYKRGMHELLSKEVTDISDEEFNKKYASLDEEIREKILKEITKIRLQKNNEFAIKEVFDEETFKENAKVLKEVVELLQTYKIRYAEKQQYLSDFFELLLTTGLKQESGQYFTPVPIARFICKAIPLNKIIKAKLLTGDSKDLLPTTIDYAAGSGHFLTESMNEIQEIIQKTNELKLKPQVKKQIAKWKADPFDWTYDYIYGIEKDYRLVKTAKVGCYLHGDGVAQVIHGDGLGDFSETKEYNNKLKKQDKEFTQDNKQFDLVISNPPYSVSAFKTNLKREHAEKDFELFKYLTDQSSEIECLFIERTKQLLKDKGIAGIILPSSILSNTGIYTKTREIMLKYFEIISIVELGSNTFMATGTNTVILFLRKRNNYDWINIKNAIEKFSSDLKDITANGVECIFSKYVKHVWKDISFKNYISIFKKELNKEILKHEIYKEYQKIKLNKNEQLIDKIIDLEKDKLLYFILAYSQKIVLVKSGEKKIEKEFLGYEFSNRRGNEGIHSIEGEKSIDKCTKLFDPNLLTNPKKVSTYIYEAFENNFDRLINEELTNHISRINLIEMLNFDRKEFEKSITLNVKKELELVSKYNLIKLNDCLETLESGKRPKGGVAGYSVGTPSIGGEHILLNGKITSKNLKFVPTSFYKNSKQGILKNDDVLICKDGALTGKVALFNKSEFLFQDSMINEHVFLLRGNNNLSQKYLFNFLYSLKGQLLLKSKITGQAQGGLNRNNLLNIKIPLPPNSIQEKIVKEISELNSVNDKTLFNIGKEKEKINQIIDKIFDGEKTQKRLGQICEIIRGASPRPIKKYVTKDKTGVNWIKIGDTKNIHKYITNTSEKITVEGSKKSRFVKEGDFILSNSMTVGKPFIVRTTGCIHDGWLLLRPSNLLSEDYLYNILSSKKLMTKFQNVSEGMVVKNLNIERVKKITIPLLKISEQNKIVKQIEKIEVQIKKLKISLKEIPILKEKVLKKYL
jgi:type I restriction enzyme M protein